MKNRFKTNNNTAISDPSDYNRCTPKTFGNTLQEYKNIYENNALANISGHGIIKVMGQDALDLLNRLSTNKLINLDAGQGIATILTNNKGRIIDLIRVINTGQELILITNPNTTQRIIEWMDLYTFDEDIEVDDITPKTSLLSISGEIIKSILNENSTTISNLYQNEQIVIDGHQVTIIKTDRFGLESFDILMDNSLTNDVWNSLIECGFSPVGSDSLEIVRIEQGVPKHGTELGENYNPLEAGLENHISDSKGCYIGQEVILRLNTYQKVQKRLRGIVLLDEPDMNSSQIEVDGKQVGLITSYAMSPILGKPLALGYLKSSNAEIDQEINIMAKHLEIKGKIIELPLKYK
jgi:folate-binding protein YgfZ